MNKFFKDAIHFKAKHFYGAFLPKDLLRGKVGDCFDHCIVLAMAKPQYRYVEGLAFIEGKWIYHAWLTDKHGLNAFDPTWYAFDNSGKERPMNIVHYLGVIMDTQLVADFMKDTGYKAVLKNYYRNRNLAQKIYDTAV